MSGSRWKGLSQAVLDEAGVTVDASGLVTIPYRRADGSVFRDRFVSRDGRMWWGEGDGLLPLGLELLPAREQAAETALLACEGESDALACREAFAGRSGPGRITGYRALALPGAGTWRPEWSLLVEPFNVVYLLGDGDEGGRRMTARVYASVPWSRPVRLPDGEDARSLLQRDGPRALDPFLDDADRTARVGAAFQNADGYAEFVQLLHGEEARRGG